MSTITPRTRTVYLLQGDDEERLDDLRSVAAELRGKSDRARVAADRQRPRNGQPDAPVQMGEVPPWLRAKEEADAADAEATAAEQAADDFAEKAKPRGVKVIMRAVGRKTWREIVKKFPPREGDEGDAIARYNVEEAPEETVPACLASPALADKERAEFLDSLSDGQYDQLAWVAHSLNKGVGADPTQRLLSVSSQTSSETSSSPSVEASSP